MWLNLQVKLYPTKQMRTYLDSQCDYRRYCWNKGLQVWNDLYDQRVISLPTSLKLKIKESLKDKTVQFTEEETALRMAFPSPTERRVRNELVADKNDWEYQNSSRVLQLTIKDLSDVWTRFFKKSQDNAGKTLIIADKYYPSTQRCSSCGYIKTGDEKITLSGNQKHGTRHNEYHCYQCGYKGDRDYNAVLNLVALI